MVSLEAPSSLECLSVKEAFPKKTLIKEDEKLSVPFTELPGEDPVYIGHTSDGVITLTNFRLLVKYKESFVNVPLGLIEIIECRDIFHLYISCKDARSFRCTFPTNEGCLEWFKRLSIILNPPQKIEDIFACAFYAWCKEQNSPVSPECELIKNNDDLCPYQLGQEIQRMGFKLKDIWRIYNNENYSTCPSYPKEHIVPALITDQQVEAAASFRSSRRFPSVVWRYQKNGMVIGRCSQPEVGWLGWRCKEDESFLQAIATACHSDKTGAKVPNRDVPTAVTRVRRPSKDNVSKVLIIDARSYTAALANRAKGGGMECADYYPDCEIVFMNLANIHAVRKSFHAVRNLCSPASTTDQFSWMSLMENTKWLNHISGLMKAALYAVNAVDKEERPVMVHCSDGWDRTPQIVALTEIMIDPYYRTIQGFQVLIEREWLSFGHKFGDRCSHGVNSGDTNERCPVFLQWLDCIHQLLLQFPCAFEFNEMFLVKLGQHVYSCLFGTFLCNNQQDREYAAVSSRTYSVWTLLNSVASQYKNYLYTYSKQVIRPFIQIRSLKFWSAMYLVSASSLSGTETDTMSADDLHSTDQPKDLESNRLSKTRSCDDIIAALESENTPPVARRLSDPNIAVDPNYLIDLQAKGSPVMTEQPNVLVETVIQGNLAIANTSPVQDVKVNNGEEIELKLIGSHRESSINNKLGDDTSEESQTLNGKVLINNLSENDGLMCNEYIEMNGDHKHVNSTASKITLNGFLENGISDCDNELDNDNNHTGSTISPKTPTPSRTSLMEHGSKSVETSTDTLVEDVNNLANSLSKPSEFIYQARCDTISTDAKETKVLNRPVNPGTKVTVSTSTSDISDSHVSVCSKELLCVTTGKPMSLDQLMLSLHTAVTDPRLSNSQNGCNSSSKMSTNSSVDSTVSSTHTPSSTCPTTPGASADFKDCNPFLRNGHGVDKYLDVDGLTLNVDPMQQRLMEIEDESRHKVDMLQTQLQHAKAALVRYTSGSSGHFIDKDDTNSLPESVESGHGPHSMNGAGSDVSWENLDEGDAQLTLWVPDHVVTHCGGCNSQFWIANRKHHCRSCGQVFCGKCTSYYVPIPQQQLPDPSRVCFKCHTSIIQQMSPGEASLYVNDTRLAANH